MTLSETRRQNKSSKQISSHVRIHDVDGKGEELRLQSQEDQELRTVGGPRQLILKVVSEDQTMDDTNKIMGNDHNTIVV